MILGRTRAVADKLLRDIRRIAFGVSLGVQIVFLAYYGWSIYSNINSLPFLIIYASLALIAVVSFVNFLIVHKHKEKKNKKFNRFLRVAKYIINGIMLAVNAYQLFKYARTDLQIILLGLSGIFWLANIVIEIIRVAAERYLALFKVAVEADCAPIFNLIDNLKTMGEVKGNIFEWIDAPLEAIANKIENKTKKLTPEQQEVKRLAEAYEKAEKEKTKQRSNERAQKEKKEIKEHLKVIKDKMFNGKNKKAK